MTQHVICRSLSVACALVGKGVGGGRGRHFIRDGWGGGAADQRSMILVKTTSKGSKGN